jgi:hypothetical protein
MFGQRPSQISEYRHQSTQLFVQFRATDEKPLGVERRASFDDDRVPEFRRP